MKRFVLTPLAEQDLNEIWDYIGDDSVEAANNVLSKIEAAICRLGEHPGLGHLRADLADSRHRFYLVYSYLIVFRPEPTRCKLSEFYMRRVTFKRSSASLPREQSLNNNPIQRAHGILHLPGRTGTYKPAALPQLPANHGD